MIIPSFFAEVYMEDKVYRTYFLGDDVIVDLNGHFHKRLEGIAIGNPRDIYRRIVQELKEAPQNS